MDPFTFLFYIFCGLIIVTILFGLFDFAKDLCKSYYEDERKEWKEWKGWVEPPRLYPNPPPRPNNMLLIPKENIELLLKHFWDAPEMYAQTSESFEDQIYLLAMILHENINLYKQYQKFKTKHGIQSNMTLASKYNFNSTPTIQYIMKSFVVSL